MFEDTDVVHRYTRRQAIEDGVLVDVSETAREAGIAYPVAITRAVYDRCVRVPAGVAVQDEAGRLWDLLHLFRMAARVREDDTLEYRLLVRNDDAPPKPVTLKAVCSPGDATEPVITIMLQEED